MYIKSKFGGGGGDKLLLKSILNIPIQMPRAANKNTLANSNNEQLNLKKILENFTIHSIYFVQFNRAPKFKKTLTPILRNHLKF